MTLATQPQPPARAGVRWWQYLGPWPYRPWAGLMAVALLSSPLVSESRETIMASPLTVIPLALIPPVAAALTLAGAFKLGARYLRGRAPRRLTTYLLYVLGSVALAIAVASIARLLLGEPREVVTAFLVAWTVRVWIWALLILAVVGVSERRLREQVQLTQEALSLSLERQLLLVVSEEKSRRQVARLLHDRVQSSLMTACLELRRAITPGGDLDHARIDSIIAKLEAIRGVDVRQAARILSPELGNVDLHTALAELALLYEPGLSTEIRIDPWVSDPAASVPEDTLLACYRIAEQGLLNSVVHGHATKATLDINFDDTGQLRLVLTDNGKPVVGSEITPGLGSAILDSWCRMFEGGWQLEFLPAGGARLTVRLECDTPANAGLTP